MARFIEYHLIQTFAPSNLNRDDVGAPKDALFGGYRRARISSQCLKRGVRVFMREGKVVDPEHFALRTRKLHQELVRELEQLGRADPGDRISWAMEALKEKKAGRGERSDAQKQTASEEAAATTAYLMFLTRDEIRCIAKVIHQNWDRLGQLGPFSAKASGAKPKDIRSFLLEIQTQLHAALGQGKAVDIALFGRMLADVPQARQDAACQMAHAVSVHEVEREFDYFTAVDDLCPQEETGAGMIGYVEFNSATFYRYAVVDFDALVKNLHDDKQLAVDTVRGFTIAMAKAIPTGKQNSFAAHNYPSFVGVVIRRSSPFNLVNAFENPVRPHPDKTISRQAVELLARQEKQLAAAYANGEDRWGYLDLTEGWKAEGGPGEPFSRLEDLASWVAEATAAR